MSQEGGREGGREKEEEGEEEEDEEEEANEEEDAEAGRVGGGGYHAISQKRIEVIRGRRDGY